MRRRSYPSIAFQHINTTLHADRLYRNQVPRRHNLYYSRTRAHAFRTRASSSRTGAPPSRSRGGTTNTVRGASICLQQRSAEMLYVRLQRDNPAGLVLQLALHLRILCAPLIAPAPCMFTVHLALDGEAQLRRFSCFTKAAHPE